MKQTELADKAGVSQSQISHLMTGKRDFTFNTIDRLLQTLGYSYQELFLQDDKNKNDNGNGNIIKFPLKTVEYKTYPEHHKELEEIYKSKNEVMISAINSNIVAFRETVKTQRDLKDALDRIRILEAKGG